MHETILFDVENIFNIIFLETIFIPFFQIKWIGRVIRSDLNCGAIFNRKLICRLGLSVELTGVELTEVLLIEF